MPTFTSRLPGVVVRNFVRVVAKNHPQNNHLFPIRGNEGTGLQDGTKVTFHLHARCRKRRLITEACALRIVTVE